MKARRFTTLGVVAVGVVALGAPAAFAQAPDVSGLNGDLKQLNSIGKAAKKQARDARKKSKFETRTDNDIKRLGNNVHELRKQIDQTNATISNIVSGLTPVLTQLGAAAQSYANFEYGILQLAYLDGGTTLTPISGAFLDTPRIDPTVQQSTVTGQFTVPAGADGDRLVALAAARSVDPTANNAKSSVSCRFTAKQGRASAADMNRESFVTSAPSATAKPSATLPFYEVKRTKLPPTDKTEQQQMPFTLVASESPDATNLTAAGTVGGADSGGAINQGFLLKETNGQTGGVLDATLSCVAIPKS